MVQDLDRMERCPISQKLCRKPSRTQAVLKVPRGRRNCNRSTAAITGCDLSVCTGSSSLQTPGYLDLTWGPSAEGALVPSGLAIELPSSRHLLPGRCQENWLGHYRHQVFKLIYIFNLKSLFAVPPPPLLPLYLS